MADPLTTGVVAGFVVQEGVRFLYGQVSELLKRVRERKGAAEPLRGEPPKDVFTAAPAELVLDPAPLVGREAKTEALLKDVEAWLERDAGGRAQSPPEAVETLRALVEALSGTDLRLRGEAQARPKVSVEVAIGRLDGRAVLVDATGMEADQDVSARGAVGHIGPDGSFTGVSFSRPAS